MNQELGKRLADFRKKNNLSQEELASKLKVSRQSISNWESGDASPSIDYIIDLSKLYGVSIDDLMNVDKSIEDCYKVKDDNLEKNKKNKDSIYISKKGIFINDKDGEKVHIEGIFSEYDDIDDVVDKVNSSTMHSKKRRKKIIKNIASLLTGISALLIIAIYILLGCLNGANWALFWPLIFLIPVPAGLINCFALKKLNEFPIVMLTCFAYFMLGMFLPNGSGWHPYWVILFLIPIYYTLANGIKNIIKNKKLSEDDDVVINLASSTDNKDEKEEE